MRTIATRRAYPAVRLRPRPAIQHTGPMPVHVLCVRHGLSTWNLARRWQGTADPPLSDEGRAGARELAAALATSIGHGPRVRIWSSNLQRAHETATIIATHLATTPVTVESRLVEADVGEW